MFQICDHVQISLLLVVILIYVDEDILLYSAWDGQCFFLLADTSVSSPRKLSHLHSF